jgi:hypothetical protein
MLEKIKSKDLQKAAEDFHHLLNRGYPRKTTLELVGNRYQLAYDCRQLLHRGVFSDTDAKSRLKKKMPLHEIHHKDLAIDGYNVIITIESGISGRPLVLGNDGFIRDISGISGSFKKTERTEETLQLVLDVLKKFNPHQVLFLFDAPISMSGQLAQEVRDYLKRGNLSGDAKAVKVPEKFLFGYPGLIATSDTAIIDRSKKMVDLAGFIISKILKLPTLAYPAISGTGYLPAKIRSLHKMRKKRGPTGKK